MNICRWVLPLCLVFLLPSCAAAGHGGLAGKPLDFYFIDAEGGAATLIVTPAGQSLLVDTGNPGTRDADRIAAAAKEAGITRIDYLVVTHYHSDHFGGAPELAKLLPIGTLYDNADQNTSTEKPSAAYLRMVVGKRIM